MTVHNEPQPAGPGPGKRVVALSAPTHEWIRQQAAAESRRRGRTFTQPEVIERLIAHWKQSGAQWADEPPGVGPCTDAQRWQIWELFQAAGVNDLQQMKAIAGQLLNLGATLTDLRELNELDAETLIAKLIDAAAQRSVGGSG